ncbi:uncharacterized protein LOC116801146 [Drosophila sechellia]|uniref:uncharacterized protein LOC116801146 n=1 Tax=Drosophila sechellia TaxID=7238 RepID=UPI0013DE2763|nr:uncharacterized protein LOC116801146 [Drosophila sechellia]
MATSASPVKVSGADAELNEAKLISIWEGITELILWRNWIKSMLAFVILQTIMYDMLSEPFVFVVSVWALIIMVISMGYRFLVQYTSTHIQNNSYPKYFDKDLRISQDLSKQLGVLVSSQVVGFLNNIREILLVKSFSKSFKWLGILLLISKFGKEINILIVGQLGLFLLFTIPKMCEMNRRLSKIVELPKFNKQCQITKVNASTETQNAMDMESLKECNGDTIKLIEKQPEGMDLSPGCDTTKESQGAGDDHKTFKVKAEIDSDDFERLADSWSDEDTLTEQKN